jgi:membrane-associated phospholipid phosphatase
MTKLQLLIAFLIVKSIYLPLNKRKSKYYWKIKWDDSIPLVPIFIIPYLGYFAIVIFSVIALWNTPYIYEFLISYICSYILAGIFWYLFPNGVARPKIEKNDIFSRMIKTIYKYDDDTNGFPSAHVFATLICCYYLTAIYPNNLLFIWLTGLLIILSTVFVKQHYIIDLLGGVVTFALSVIIGGLLW